MVLSPYRDADVRMTTEVAMERGRATLLRAADDKIGTLPELSSLNRLQHLRPERNSGRVVPPDRLPGSPMLDGE